ncbi:MAG: PAS domain S-box protein [Verrucomicrobiota bacterium]|nr:PAS domain S-box protein [Verrucomicrobiota bacterium]
MVSSKGRWLRVNRALCELFGYSEAELLNLGIADVTHPDDVEFSLENLRRAIAGQQRTFQIEKRYIHRDGHFITALLNISLVHDSEGKPAYFITHIQDISERKRAETEMKRTLQRLNDAQRIGQIGDWEFNLQTGAITWSPQVFEILGRNPVLGPPRDCAENAALFSVESQALMAERLERATASGEPQEYELEARRSTGEWLHVLGRAVPRRDESGEVAGLYGTLQDITGQKVAEGQLRKSRTGLQNAQRIARLGSWEWDLSTNEVECSQEIYQIFGFPPSELRITHAIFMEAIHPADREAVRLSAEGAVAGGKAFDVDHRICHPDGSERFVHTMGEVTRDHSGTPICMAGTVHDITARKRIEQDLRAAEEKYRSIFENASEGIFQNTPAGVMISANPALARILGFDSPEELIKERNDIGHQGYADPSQREEFQRLVEKDGVVNDFVYEVKRKDGTIICVSENVRAVCDAAGTVLYYEGSAEDITESRRSDEILNESERRFRFLNDLSEATRSLSAPAEIMATVATLLGKHLGISRCAYAEVEEDGDHFVVRGNYLSGCASIMGRYQLSGFGEHTHSGLSAGRTIVLRDVGVELAPPDGDAYDALAIKAMIACPLTKNGRLVAAMAVHHLAPRDWSRWDIALVEEVTERCWSILERARAALEVREREEHLRLVIAASNDGVFEHDFDSDALTWSDRMFEMLGLERSSFVPTLAAFTALLHSEDLVPFERAAREQVATGNRYAQHLRIARADGSYGSFLARASAVLDDAGRATGLVGCLSDLTSLVSAEQKLLEQASLLDLAHDAIMVHDMDDRITYWNAGAEQLYGWRADEVLGKTSSSFLHHEGPSAIAGARAAMIERGEWAGERKHLRKSGVPVIVRSRWTLVRDEAGEPKAALIINTDVTEQKKVEEQFLRAQRLESIGTLASGVAHDLNNILVPILMVAPILRGDVSASDRTKFLDIVEASAQRGASIVRQVLTFARGAEGDRVLLQPIYLLQEIAKIAQETFPKKISVRTRYPENIRMIEADATQLHQVLLNLCINARDAMPNGGTLTVELADFDVDDQYASMTPGAVAGPYVTLRVTDTGTGIARHLIDKIFDPFFTTKEAGVGTGLGLSTVIGIVKSHGGFMKVESEAGQTSFKVFLPAAAGVATAAKERVKINIPRGNGELILVVDDEEPIREIAEALLVRQGYRVMTAPDGPSAIALFAQRSHEIDVVMTDMSMPFMDGVALIRTLRKMKPAVRVILSSGSAEGSERPEWRELGVNASLAKPYDQQQLLLCLQQVIQPSLPAAA